MMVLSQLLLTAFAFTALAQEAKQPPLNPFAMGLEDRKAGNPLKQYAEMLRLEKDFLAKDRNTYFQALATVKSNLGDIAGAIRAWGEFSQPRRGTGPIFSSPLDGMTPRPAVQTIAGLMKGRNVLMIGEEHVKPQTRTILIPLLRELRKQGFEYFAAETFNDDLSETLRRGYALESTGTYTADPIFAEGVREAIKLGYKLVPYEHIEAPPPMENAKSQYRQNFREKGQAVKLKERIFDKTPNAKVIVWAGRAHVYEQTADVGDDVWEPMAYWFKRLTGIDPLTVYLPTHSEESRPELEVGNYRYATHNGWVKAPTVFLDKQGKPFGESFDVQVFFPRAQYVKGRPDWMFRELNRRAVEIPHSILAKQGMQVVQAHRVGEPPPAIPADQIVIHPGDPIPVLMLPKGDRFSVRAIDPDGKEIGKIDVRT